MQIIFGLIGEWLQWLVFYLLLLPVTMVLATPVILIGAAFTKRPYGESVRDAYSSVYNFWDNVLPWIV